MSGTVLCSLIIFPEERQLSFTLILACYRPDDAAARCIQLK